VSEAKKRDLKLAVCQNDRFRRGARTVKGLIETRRVGDPYYAIVNFHKALYLKGFRKTMPNPLLIDMSIHHFDLMRFLFDADAESVFAESWRPEWSWFDGDPSVTVIVNMENGIRVCYAGSWITKGWETTWDGDWRIECSNGEIRWDKNIKITLESKEKVRERLVSMPLEDRLYLLYEFAEAIAKNKEPETSGEDNLKSLAMVFAAIDSAETGRRISVKEYL